VTSSLLNYHDHVLLVRARFDRAIFEYRLLLILIILYLAC